MIERAKQLARLAVRLAISLGLLGVVAWAVDGASLWCRLASADISWFVLAVVLGIVANIVSAWRWSVIARHLGLTAPARTLLPAYGCGVTLNTFLPGATLGGDAYRALALQQLGNPMLKSAASVALDRLSGLWALFVISWLAWLIIAINAPAGVAGAAVLTHLTGTAIAVVGPFLARRLHNRLALDPHGLASRLLLLFAETVRLAQMTFVSSAVIQIVTIAALWAALNAVTGEVPLLYLIAVSAPVFLAAALPVSIGGYGTREAVLAAYWLLAGLPADVAVAGSLLHGLAVTLQGALWAPIFLFRHK